MFLIPSSMVGNIRTSLSEEQSFFYVFFFWQALHSNRNGKNIAIFSEQFPIYCEFAMADLLNEIKKFSNNRITERK
jgi:hypothetical protein